MARLRTLHIGALNIKTQPESTATYASLMRKAYELATAVRFRGSRGGMIGKLSEEEFDGELIQVGTLDMFTQIDFNKAWYNIRSKQQAEAEDVQSIKVPPNLKPEHRRVEFVFFPHHHRLFFDSGHLSPSAARTLMEGLLNSQDVRGNGPEVTVLIEQGSDELTRIYSLKQLRTLEIVVTRPNPDDLGGFEKDLKEQLEKQRAKKFSTSLEAEEGKSLQPDDRTRKLADVALSDGYVVGTGRNENGRAVRVSTQTHPLREMTTFSPDETSLEDVLVLFASKVLEKIIRRRR